MRIVRDRLHLKPRQNTPPDLDPLELIEKRKTMTLDAIAAEKDVSRSYVQKILKDHYATIPAPPPDPPEVYWKKQRKAFGSEPLPAAIPYTMAILQEAMHLDMDSRP
jgi:hypothetical protein